MRYGEMNEQMEGKPDYGNWVSKRLIYIPGVTGLVFLGLAFFFPILLVLALPFLFISAYFAYARYLFSPRGGNVLDKVYGLVLAHLDWNGEGQLLDIGCGNGALTIKLAKRYPKARVVGIDYWGENWEYSKNVCERNAKLEGVNERVSFRKASASALPFEDGSLDAAVSNLVFHEVKDAGDKRELIREALRVVKKGGNFAFQDLFSEKHLYGDTDDLIRTIQGWGIKKVEFIDTSNEPFIPRALKLPFMVGTIGIIAGEK
jgi:SAM-dependent methyltransferase